MRISISLLLASILLVSCGGDKSACPAGDLARFARDEGLRGHPASLPAAGCELDAAEQDTYASARADGLNRYCTAAHGYALAVDGKQVDLNLCEETAAKELKRGFEIGENLRQHLAQHELLLRQAKDAEQLAATLEAGIPARTAIEHQAATLRLEARAKENDVEALRGIVAIEKWR